MKFKIVFLIFLTTISIKAFAQAGTFSESMMYSAEDFADVPADFRLMTYQEAQSNLQMRANARCGDRGANLLGDWKEWRDNVMTYGKQRYYLGGTFGCQQ